jgi:Helitron helicase-like domain at N-terminus
MFLTYALTRREDMNLEFWERSQARFRSVPYADLMDHVAQHAALNTAVPGRVVVLPRSFARSQRAYDAMLRDQLACVQHVGFPHLFITVTANPCWPEIVRNRVHFPNDDSNNIDITNRLLEYKIRMYLKLIIDGYIFGVHLHHTTVDTFHLCSFSSSPSHTTAS